VEVFFRTNEAYQVSVLAQAVGTDGPLAAKRLKNIGDEIERMS
jgi:hypothetical protein